MQAPWYHLAIEGALVVWVVWLLGRKPTPLKQKLTKKVKAEHYLRLYKD